MMKKLIYIFILMFTLNAAAIAQEGKATAAKVDEEDKELLDDLYLSDTEFFLKYVEQMASADSAFLYKSYSNLEDPEIKIYILRIAVKKGLSDEWVYRIFMQALAESVNDINFRNLKKTSDSWKVRAAAAYLIYQNPSGIDAQKKLDYVRVLVSMIREDPEERGQAASALALGKLFETEEGGDGDAMYKRYDLLRKDTIVAILNEKLNKIHINDQFLCWALVKSLGYLKSEKSFFLMLKTRKKGFNQKVMLEISRTTRAITGGGGSSPAKTN